MKKAIIIISICFAGFTELFSSSLYSPFPTTLSAGINPGAEISIKELDHLRFSSKSYVFTDFSLFPGILSPFHGLYTGASLSYYISDNKMGFNFSINSGLEFILNPFYYRDSFYELDKVLGFKNSLELSYRFMCRSVYIDPFVSGNIHSFWSLTDYYGIKNSPGLELGVRILIPIDL